MTEITRHPKRAKAFSRRILMDIAKTVRNCRISENNREIVTRALANYFSREDQFFDRDTFMGLASGKLDNDTRTRAFSTVQEKQDDSEV